MGGHAFGQALRRLQCDDEGAATAEFAVVLPVIVMLGAGHPSCRSGARTRRPTPRGR